MTNSGGGRGQQPSVGDITRVLDPDDVGTKPISCPLSLPTALTIKGRRILAPVKFAKVFQVRHYKTTLPCTEFVDHKWYHQDRCDRPLKKTKSPVKEETYEQWIKDNFQHRRNNLIYKLYRRIDILKAFSNRVLFRLLRDHHQLAMILLRPRLTRMLFIFLLSQSLELRKPKKDRLFFLPRVEPHSRLLVTQGLPNIVVGLMTSQRMSDIRFAKQILR